MSNLPAGASWVNPYLRVSDVSRIANFYQTAFGFQIRELAPGPEGTICHGELVYREQLIMIGNFGNADALAPPAISGMESPMALYLYCDKVDTFYETALAAGALSVDAPHDTFWGDRMCRVKDPDGYIWAFATFSGTRS